MMEHCTTSNYARSCIE